jgi:CRISPR/Cas system-associated protein endoribonuclease Cas2
MIPMINFDEQSHEYTRNGVTYISTTQLLKKFGLSADYAGIPDAVLQKAANKGKAVHKGLELYIQGDDTMISLIKEVELFNNYVTLKALDRKAMIPEQVIYNDQYRIAGTVDLQYVDGNSNIIADFKTTSTLHIDVVAWQLSIYNYILVNGDLMKYYFNKLQAIHFNNGRMYVKEIYTVDYDAVKALLEANNNNATVFNYVKPNKVISTSQETLIKQLLTEKKAYEEHLETLDKEIEVVLNLIKDDMEKHKEYSYKTPDLNIVYTPEVRRRSLNQTKVKEYLVKQGEDIDNYMNETTSAPSIKASIPKVKTSDVIPF